MQFFAANTHEFTAKQLDGKIIMTGDAYFGRVAATDQRDTIDIYPLVLGGGFTGTDVAYLDDLDVVILSEEEAAGMLAPIRALITEPAPVTG